MSGSSGESLQRIGWTQSHGSLFMLEIGFSELDFLTTMVDFLTPIPENVVTKRSRQNSVQNGLVESSTALNGDPFREKSQIRR